MKRFFDTPLRNRPKSSRDIVIVMVAFIVSLVGLLILITDMNPTDTNMAYHQRIRTLSRGWHIESDTMNEVVDLPVWVDAEPGETITISTKVPPMDSPYSTVVTRNYHQKISAYLEDNRIYYFPNLYQKTSDTIITDDWNMIYLPQSSANRSLFIRFDVGQAPFHGYISPILFGEDNAVMSYLQSEHRLSYYLSLAIILTGLLLIVIATVYTRDFSDKHSFILGFVFISAGTWFADRSKMPIFMVGSNMKFFVAFSVLTLVPVLISLYAGERFKDHNQTLPNVLTGACIVFDAILFGTVALKRIPIHTLIPYVYLVTLITCLYLAWLMWHYAYGKARVLLNRVQLNAIRMEFIAALATLVFSFISIVFDAVTSNNWSSANREWSGIGTIQVLAVAVFSFAHLIILLYTSYYGVLESESIQKQLHDSQLQLMMGQIQPHFTFNTLSSIRTLIKIDPDTAYEMIYNFSNYLRANVDNLTNLDGIPFSDEIEHIKSYVNIEKVRFGDRLNVKYDIQEADFIVPPLAIQPLVENAIKHGVCKKTEGGTVWLKSYRDASGYVVEVNDDGVGITPERLNEVFYGSSRSDNDAVPTGMEFTGNGSETHQSTGMRNIVLRLKEICNATLDVNSTPGEGTTMKVLFPDDGQPKSL